MGRESTLDTIKSILVFFINENNIGTIQDISRVSGRDRTAIKRYLEFYCDLMILKKFKYGLRELYCINPRYKDLFKESNIINELMKTKL